MNGCVGMLRFLCVYCFDGYKSVSQMVFQNNFFGIFVFSRLACRYYGCY